MRLVPIRTLALAIAGLTPAAWGFTPPDPADPGKTLLEITLGRATVPAGEVLDWELVIDGSPVVPRSGLLGVRAWSGAFKPGPHTIGVRVQYRRDMKTLVDRLEGDRVGFTFVAGSPRWVGQEYLFDARPSSVVRLAAIVDDDPSGIADRLVLALEERPRELSPKPGNPRWQGEFAMQRLVQERAAWVAGLLSRRLVPLAGRGGEARARVSVDERGYVRAWTLEGSTGSEVLDRGVEEVLRLGQPYPVFQGEVRVTIWFGGEAASATGEDGLVPSPLTKLPDYLRAR